LEESNGGQQVVILTEATSEQGAGSDPENQSGGCGDSETASDDGGRVKIEAEAALAGINYDFGQSTITRAHLVSLVSVAHYFLKGYARSPGVESF
jgi:hypothetical protein